MHVQRNGGQDPHDMGRGGSGGGGDPPHQSHHPSCEISQGVLLEVVHLPPAIDIMTVAASIAEEVLAKHENIMGMEIALPIADADAHYEGLLDIYRGVLDIPIYVPVHLAARGDVRGRMECVNKMMRSSTRGGIVVNVVLESGAQAVVMKAAGKGVDWVLSTTRNTSVWRELEEEGVRARGFRGVGLE